MYANIPKIKKTDFATRKVIIGEPLEAKIRNMIESKKIIEADETPMMYSGERDSPIPGTDIRADRFEIAREFREKMGQVIAQKVAYAKEAGRIYDEETDQFIDKFEGTEEKAATAE